MNRRDFFQMLTVALAAPLLPTAAKPEMVMGIDPAFAVGGDKSVTTIFFLMKDGSVHTAQHDKRSYQLPITIVDGEECWSSPSAMVKLRDIVGISTAQPKRS